MAAMKITTTAKAKTPAPVLSAKRARTNTSAIRARLPAALTARMNRAGIDTPRSKAAFVSSAVEELFQNHPTTPDQSRAVGAALAATDRERRNARRRKSYKLRSSGLAESYVRQIAAKKMEVSVRDLPQSIIDLMRDQIRLWRTIHGRNPS